MSARQKYKIFHTAVDNWFPDDCLVKIDGVDYCMDDKKWKVLWEDFAKVTTKCLCIGALDGWLVRIKKLSIKRDGFPYPGFC